ncbi:MAG TPA: hypothetical protein VK982_10495 [Bacteroidales bacterium]|nr:hypothetical protein [Bacteroidales bacterium]
MTSVEFTCKCGKNKAYISEEVKTTPCPECGRVYKGVYNKKKYTIKPVELYRIKCMN